MRLDDVLISRRSIRSFRDKAVPDKDICAVVEAARISPSAKNRQPWRFVLLSRKEKADLLSEMSRLAEEKKDTSVAHTAEILASAPAIIAVYALGTSYSDTLSVGAAMYALCLKATDLGLGSLWACDTDILKGMKKYSDLAGVVALGYPAEMPAPRPRKKLEEISNLTAPTESPVYDELTNADLSDIRYVFVSYSHSDADVVRADIVELKKHGIPLWYDRALLSGKKWDEQALAYLEDDRCVCFLWYVSEASLSSDAVYEEFRAAMEKRASTPSFRFVPVLIGESSATSIIERLRAKGEYEKADAYESFFGREDKTLFIERSLTSFDLRHIEKLLAGCFDSGIAAKHSIYDNYLYEIRQEKAIITGYQGTAHSVVIPDEISGYPVTEVGESAFVGNETIEVVTVPNTVKRLGLGAFRGTRLAEISLPDSIEELCTACFRDCIYLKRVVLPRRITYLAEALFRGCTALKEVLVPDGVTEMKEAVFRGCSAIEEITMPSSLSVMTEGGFYGCSALRVLHIPQTVCGAEIQSFDTSPLLTPVRIGEFIFAYGKGRKADA